MKTNKKPVDFRKDYAPEHRLAGGYGPHPAKQEAEALLRRSVMACLLWEDAFYQDGESIVDNIKSLIPQVDPLKVSEIAIEARTKQKLRHVPLLVAREMARLPEHKRFVSTLLPKIILRADELTEFVSLYWQDGKQPLSKQVKLGLASAFTRFNEYHLAKYNRDESVKLRDVLFLCHAKPKDEAQADLWKRLVDGKLAIPDTWEVSLSAKKDKKATWERLIAEDKLGALAFVRNLRNMEEASVDPAVIRSGFETINSGWLLPLNFVAAAKAAPRWERELETMMLRGLAQSVKLPGYTILIVDVSGSMTGACVSSKSDSTRLDAGAALAMLAAESCERISIYATAGSDSTRTHETEMLPPRHGFAVIDMVLESVRLLGGGGIFTRQCLEYVKGQEREQPDRIIIFSDSQDCDRDSRLPSPFGNRNYIVDVSSHDHGVNYKGLWTAEVSGWSEHFLTYIAALEGLPVGQSEE